eukprot:gene3376-8282_t
MHPVLPHHDEDSIEYLASMLEDYSEEADDDILGFLEDMLGSDHEARSVLQEIKKNVLDIETEHPPSSSRDDDHTSLLNKPVIMAQTARATEDRIRGNSSILFNSGSVNTNDSIPSWNDEEDPGSSADMTPEAMLARAKQKKKDAKREKKDLKRERVIAPIRSAILETLTQKPVVIHRMLGEDGSYGGSPCVDIVMKQINIDLAGMTILENTDLTL